MATCPRCGRFLDADHRCRGLWRLRLRVLRSLTVGALVGAASAAAVAAAALGAVSLVSLLAGMIIGIVVVFSLMRGEAS